MTLVKAAQKSEVLEGAVKVLTLNGVNILLCNNEDKYYAISNICTHDNAPLGEGELEGKEIECPRHGAKFDVQTGRATCLPAVLPVQTYKVEVKGEDIWVDLP